MFTQLHDQTVLFLTIQFSISHLIIVSLNVSFIWPTNRTLSGGTTLDQNEPGNDGNERALHILQRSNITGASPCLFSIISRMLIGRILPPQQRSSQCILKPQPTEPHNCWLVFYGISTLVGYLLPNLMNLKLMVCRPLFKVIRALICTS